MSEIYMFKLRMRRILENWRYWAGRIAHAANTILGGCEVYVFGSVAEGSWSGGSDLDILIVVDKPIKSNRERSELKAQIEERAGLPLIHPIEIHLIDRSEFKWYYRHAKKLVKIK